VFWFAGPWDDDQVSAEGTDTCDLLYLGESLRWTDGAQGGVQAPVERGVGNSVQALDLDCGKPIDRRHRPERVGSGNAPFGIRVKWSDDTIVFSRKSAASERAAGARASVVEECSIAQDTDRRFSSIAVAP